MVIDLSIFPMLGGKPFSWAGFCQTKILRAKEARKRNPRENNLGRIPGKVQIDD
jgi:hypothetical protein